MTNWFLQKKQNVANSEKELMKWSATITQNAVKTGSKIRCFLANVIKEMISKEILKNQKEEVHRIQGVVQKQVQKH